MDPPIEMELQVPRKGFNNGVFKENLKQFKHDVAPDKEGGLALRKNCYSSNNPKVNGSGQLRRIL